LPFCYTTETIMKQCTKRIQEIGKLNETKK